VEKLTGCLAAIGESRYREMILNAIQRQQENERYSQENSVSSNVANKSASPLSPKSTPVTNAIPTETDVPLKSERGVDYTNLRDLLAAKKWREADRETARVLKVAGVLDSESIEKFPCEDLRTIDQLWVKCSNGRFGFSVQKRIYQSLGGTRKYDEKVWEKFGDRVGWRKNNEWLSYGDYTFSEKAPEGHLPQVELVELRGVCWWVWVWAAISSLASRLVKCNI